MNVRRPAILFLGSTILGIIIAYSELEASFKLMIIAIAIFLYLKLFFDGKISKRILLIIFAFMLLGFYRFKIEDSIYDRYEKIVLSLPKGNKILDGKVESIGKSTNSNYYVLSNCIIDGKALGTCRCYFDDEINPYAKIGNNIRVTGGTSINEAPSNIGEFNQRDYYRSQGISFISFAKEFIIVNDDYDKLRQGIYDIKLKIKDQITKIFDEKDAGLFSAMVTGDKSTIDKEQKRLFSDNGIAHILAISGLHLSILGLVLFELLRKRFSITLSAFVVSVFILFYGIFIDAGATSLRAITMLYIRFLSLSLGRTYDSKNTLYVVCFVFLMLHPYLLFNAGFQFSYVAIFALNEDVHIYIKKKVDKIGVAHDRKIKIKFPAIIVLTIFLFPITIYHYFTYPLYSVLLNIIVIPLMSFVLGFGLIGLIISFFILPLGRIFTFVVHIIFLIYDKLCYLIEKLPFHLLWLGKPTIYEILFYYVAIFLIIYAINKDDYVKIRNEKVERGDFLKKISYNFIFNLNIRPIICLILLVLSVLVMSIRTHSDFRMTFLSIGQGDAIIIESRDAVLTIDGGSTSNKSAGQYIELPHIKSRALSHVDYAFVSHADSDHTNALIYMLDNEDELKFKHLVLPINAKTDKAYDKLKLSAESSGLDIIYAEEGDTIDIKDGLKVEVLSPDMATILANPNKKKKNQLDINELSLVFRVNYKGKTALFTGDTGIKNIQRMLLDDKLKGKLKSDVLKVPHHGSKNSLNEDFYKAVNPSYAVISYGKTNTYGHPHKVVLDALSNLSIDTLKTGTSGEIDIYFDKEKIKTKTFR